MDVGEYYGGTEQTCACCGGRFRDVYIESWCQLCRGSDSDCMPGRCALPDKLPPDPLAAGS